MRILRLIAVRIRATFARRSTSRRRYWRVMIAAMAAMRHPTIIGDKQVFLEGKRILATSGTGLGKTYFEGIQT